MKHNNKNISQNKINRLASFIDHILKIECLCFCCIEKNNVVLGPCMWVKGENPQMLSDLQFLSKHLTFNQPLTIEHIHQQIVDQCPEIFNKIIPHLHLITYQQQPLGIALIGCPINIKTQQAFDYEIACELLDLFVGEMMHDVEKNAYEKLFYTIINGITDYIYVTDPKTDEILFMNEPMKKAYHLDDPIGKTCWKILQRDKNKHCECCPIERLNKKPDQTIIWEEKSTFNQRCYENKDSLIYWLDGRLVHLQQSTDITDYKMMSEAATIDELTKLTNRRAGKIKLEILLNQSKKEDKSLCLVLMDINGLKQTNDTYGHKVGDNKICYITKAIRDAIRTHDLFFRLSGDEFVLAFYDTPPIEVRHMMCAATNKLTHLKNILDIPYDLGFCYGMVPVKADNLLSLETLLSIADEKMYEQKRMIHLRQNEIYLEKENENIFKIEDFDYDKEHLYDALVQSTDDYVYVCNMKTGMFRYSLKMVQEFNLPGQVLKNAAAIWGSKIHPLDKDLFLKSNQEIADGRVSEHCVEYRAINRHNEWVWLRCRGHVIFDELGEPNLFAGIISNIGRKDKIDPLTGLFNRFALEEDIKNHIALSNDHLVLLLLNLDNFKSINQLRDHSFGDEVLKQAAQNICQSVPTDANVYKLGSDEFAVVLKSNSILQIEAIYKKIKEPFSHQQAYLNEHYFCSISAGCAIYPDNADAYINLIKYASYALEASKKNGKDQLSFFSDEIVEEHLRKLTLTEELRYSVEHHFKGFSLQFQPIVYTQTKKIRGAEALMRWCSDTYGPISPVEFIPLLEDSRMIISVGRWAFEKAIIETKKFLKINPNFIISINLSYVQVSPTPIIPYIQKILEEKELNPKHVIVEFTESYLASDNILSIYRGLRELGITIAMDDFGTGYSSLSVLKQCPADIIKIDQGFVKKITHSNFDLTLLRMIIELCHEVGIAVCVEGIEFPPEYEVIKELAPDFLQGFLFGKPSNSESLIKLIKSST